jgi:hypothetical protein
MLVSKVTDILSSKGPDDLKASSELEKLTRNSNETVKIPPSD